MMAKPFDILRLKRVKEMIMDLSADSRGDEIADKANQILDRVIKNLENRQTVMKNKRR